MKLLLEKAAEHLDAAIRHRERRDCPATRRHYLKSAEFLFKAAAQSSGRMRLTRLSTADELVSAAHKLEDTSHPAGVLTQEAPEEESRGSFLVRERPEIRFGDVAGLDEAKEEVRLRLIYPLEYPEKASRYHIRRGGGVLLFGPPGAGKTLLARAVAGEIGAPFFTAKPSQLMSKWVGESEQNVERIFDQARRCRRAVVFIDEVEAMLPARRSSNSSVMRRVVPQVLAELQGFARNDGTLLFMGATNEPWAIDPAALRPGRFDARVYVGLPDVAARRRLLDVHLTVRPLARGVDLGRIAADLAGYSGADVADICERCAARVFLSSIRSGRDRDITVDDVRAVIAEVRPSVSSSEEIRYRQWAHDN